jgi:hypothetical protein
MTPTSTRTFEKNMELQPKTSKKEYGRNVDTWRECGRNAFSLCFTISVGDISSSQTPNNTQGHRVSFRFLIHVNAK